MKASELRIGNYFNWSTIASMGTGQGVVYVSNIGYHHLMEPIPLTEEWLKRFGFKHGEKSWFIGHSDYTYHLQGRNAVGFKDGGYFMGIRFDDWDPDPETINKFTYDVKYVHQLMNLYFALTGEELTLKETV